MKRIVTLLVCAIICIPNIISAYDQTKYVEDKPLYNISGTLKAIGSETLQPIMKLWGKKFCSYHPNITISFNAEGSVTAPPALISGDSNLAPMSRKMTYQEVRKFDNKFGYKPVFVRVALDALAIYINKNNPLNGMTLQQLDGIFSSTYSCRGKNITKWGSLLFGSLSDQSINIYGRNNLSGTYAYFKRKALCGGEYKTNIEEFKEQDDIINAVANDISGIGYGGLGYRRTGIKILALANREDEAFIPYYVEKYKNDPDPTKRHANIFSGKYPLSRFLYIYVNKHPENKLPPVTEEFLRFVLSRVGQDIVEKTGYIPLPGKIVDSEIKKISTH